MVGLDGVNVDLFPGEVLAVIGDNGAGKSTLIKALTGALIPDSGQVFLDGQEVHFKTPQDARSAGIETVYQTLAVAPALDIAANMFLGRERRRRGPLGSGVPDAGQEGHEGGRRARRWPTWASPPCRTCPRPWRPCPAVSGRRWRWPGRPPSPPSSWCSTSRPRRSGVKETGQVLNLIQQIKAKGLPVILISHNMPNVFEVSDRIHIARLGGCAGVITPKSHTPTEAVAIMTGATTLAKG